MSRGRNRTLEDVGAGGHLFGNRLAHAEMNALLSLDHKAVDPRTCTLYTANEPCPLCTGAVAMYGVRTIRYAARDAYGGGVALLNATPLLRQRQIRVTGPEHAGLEIAVVAIRVEFRLRRGQDRAQAVLAAAVEVLPVAVRLGEALFEAGTLDALRRGGAPAGEVVERIGRQLRSVW